MSKLVLNDVLNINALSVINDNFDKIEAEFQNEVLYRQNPVGEPNQMQNTLDMNGQRIINLPEPVSPSEAARLQDVTNAISGGAANLIPFTPVGNISSTNVQAAIAEEVGDLADTGNAANGDALIGVKRIATGAIGTTLHNWIETKFVDAKAEFGASTAALQAAIDAVGVAGGGVVYIAPGNYSLINTGPGLVGGGSGTTSWDNRWCLQVRHNNVYILLSKGAVLTLANGENAHVIKFGQREGTLITVSNGGVYGGGEIHGNRANQTFPTVTDNHWHGIDVSTGCSRITLDDLYIHQCQYYGIGFERDNFNNCVVSRILIEDVGADGIDCKDDSGTSSGNSISNITVRRFGLAPALSLQAGINPRGGWSVDNVRVIEFSGTNHGIRYDRSQNAENPEGCEISNFVVEASALDTTVGVFINSSPSADEAIVSTGRITGCAIGLDSRAAHVQLDSIRAKSCTTGIQIFQHTQVDNCATRSCGTGVNVRASTNTITNLHSYSNTVGANVEAGSTGTHFRGGVFSGNTTNLTDSGSQTAMSHVGGVRTHSVGTLDFAIDSTGEKSLTITHNLDFTPNIDDVLISFKRNTNVTDHRIGYYYVVAVDATSIFIRVFVSTASATGGALMTAVVNCMAKKAPRQ